MSTQLRRTRGLAITAAALSFAGVAWVGASWRGVRNPSAVEAAESEVMLVKVLGVERANTYTLRREYTGEVAALRASELGFEREGKLVWLGADRGDVVAAGTVLARLDSRRLAAQRQQLVAQRERAVAQLQELQTGPRQEDIAAAEAEVRDFDDQIALDEIRSARRQYLHQEGAISREQFDEVAYRLDALRDRRDAARERLQELLNGTRTEQVAAQAATVRELDAAIAGVDVDLDKSVLRAPFAGAIAARFFDEGAVVGSGRATFRLIEQQRPEVEIGIPADRAGSLPESGKIFIGDRTYRAQLKALLPEVDPATRTRAAIFELDVRPGAVAPGEIARLEVVQANLTEGFWLPMAALVRGDRGLWAAYGVVPGEEAFYVLERRDLEILHAEGDRVLVRGTLQAGDLIVADGAQRVVPGQRVRWTE